MASDERPAAPIVVEVCIDAPQGLAAATACAVDRLELCADLSCGGVTPSLGFVDWVRARTDLPLVALVRPRPGDFVYETDELDVAVRDIGHLVRAGVEAVCIGALRADGRLDASALERLRDAAPGLEVVLHRAFDLARDLDEALELAIELGFRRILTSGGAASAPAGAARIAALTARAAGRIELLAGGGLRANNVAAFLAASRARGVHLSAGALEPGPWRGAGDVSLGRPAAAPNEAQRRTTDAAELVAFLQAVRPG